VLKELKRLDEALTSYDRAIELKSDYAEAYSNRGIVLKELKRLDEALTSYDRAIEFKRDYAEAYWNKSLALLLQGEFIKGFNEYEWRWKNENIKKMAGERSFTQPLWLGAEDIAGKTILLHAEQGLGDTLQFCRYAMLVAELGAKIILEVQKPLVNLLQNLTGVSQLVAKGSALPE
jgi:tetratricopeptide (TPR) repeat protein